MTFHNLLWQTQSYSIETLHPFFYMFLKCRALLFVLKPKKPLDHSDLQLVYYNCWFVGFCWPAEWLLLDWNPCELGQVAHLCSIIRNVINWSRFTLCPLSIRVKRKRPGGEWWRGTTIDCVKELDTVMCRLQWMIWLEKKTSLGLLWITSNCYLKNTTSVV